MQYIRTNQGKDCDTKTDKVHLFSQEADIRPMGKCSEVTLNMRSSYEFHGDFQGAPNEACSVLVN